MKANELMIGDWVNFLIDIEGGDTEYDPVNEIYQPMQVDSISTLDKVSSAFFGVTNDVAQLQPIPLTAEILERNGFVKIWNGSWKMNDSNLMIDEDNGLYVGISMLSVRLDYVHELQHILRCCLIEKEIEL